MDPGAKLFIFALITVLVILCQVLAHVDQYAMAPPHSTCWVGTLANTSRTCLCPRRLLLRGTPLVRALGSGARHAPRILLPAQVLAGLLFDRPSAVVVIRPLLLIKSRRTSSERGVHRAQHERRSRHNLIAC